MSEMEYDFSQGKRGAVVPTEQGKTRITIRVDTDILNWFKAKVHDAGGGNYQTLINMGLREFIQNQDKTLEDTLRRIIKEELQQTACSPRKRRIRSLRAKKINASGGGVLP
jgi:hypothetical protein